MNKRQLNILHIGYCPDDPSSGVAVAIPGHLTHQSKSDSFKISFLNLCSEENKKLTDINVFLYKDYPTIKSLPNDFNSPDLIVFHELYRIPFLKLSQEAKRNNIPYVIIPHGGLTNEAQSQKKLKKILGNKLLFNKYIYSAKAIQFLSLSEKERSKKFIKKQSIIISGNGINIPKMKYKIHNPLKITFIGRYDVYFKGLDLLLNSIKKIANDLKKEKISVQLYGIGKKADEEYIKNYILENKINDICKMHGPIFGKEKDTILKETDLFLQPSRSEGQPLGIMEALAYGIPVIVTPGTGLVADAQKYNFGITSEFNEDMLSTAILNIIKNKENLIKMSKNSREYAEKNYSWDIIIEQLLTEYSKLIGG